MKIINDLPDDEDGDGDVDGDEERNGRVSARSAIDSSDCRLPARIDFPPHSIVWFLSFDNRGQMEKEVEPFRLFWRETKKIC